MERKKQILTSVFTTVVILVTVSLIAAAECWTSCSTDEAYVVHHQTADGWTLSIHTEDGVNTYTGDGQYSGTLCNGVSPCEVQEA